MSDQDLAMDAAEYVLGTLSKAERADFSRRLVDGTATQALVRDWEQRLSPIAAVVPEIAPSPSLFDKIERDIDARASGANVVSASVVALRRSLVRWRVATGATAALAASLAAFGVMRGPVAESVPPKQPQVAQIAPETTRAAASTPAPSSAPVLARGERTQGGVSLASGDRDNSGGLVVGGRAPSWAATLAPVGERPGLVVDLDGAGRLAVRRVRADIPEGKTLALWLLAPGGAPRAIGAMSNEFARFDLQGYSPDAGAEIAASFEPKMAGLPNQPSAPYSFRGRLVRQ